MFALILQATGAVPSAAQIEELQRQAMEAAQVQVPVATKAAAGGWGGMMGSWGPMMGVMAAFFLLFVIIAVVLAIINLMNIYHWGMTDKAAFDSAKEDKKKWFYILVLVPMVACAVMAIPFIGWLVGAIAYIYWLVMTLMYFFGVRMKIK